MKILYKDIIAHIYASMTNQSVPSRGMQTFSGQMMHIYYEGLKYSPSPTIGLIYKYGNFTEFMYSGNFLNKRNRIKYILVQKIVYSSNLYNIIIWQKYLNHETHFNFCKDRLTFSKKVNNINNNINQ